jgi:predicted CXXCH cytochrome family protein
VKRRRRTGAGAGAGPRGAPAAATPAADRRLRRSRWLPAWGLVVLALVSVAGWWLLGTGTPDTPTAPTAGAPAPAVSAAAPPAAYVDNRECLGCHAEQRHRWQDSHHAKAMAPADARSVLGRFDGAEFEHEGVTSRFFTRDSRYFVRTDGPDGQPAEFEIAYTFGVAPLQQYLIEQPGGRLQPLQIAWDDVRKRWFHLLPHETAPPGDVLHWTGRYQTANTMCISCHTTGFEKRYDEASDTFASRWQQVNVSCQACHGPGERHVQWAGLHREGKAAPTAAGERFGLAVSLGTSSAKQQVEVCAACHSRRSELTATPLPGATRLDHYLPALLTEGLYHADGQQLDEVFVDGSYRQSRMYQRGVGCTACHDPHTAKLKAPGNAVCLQCHGPQADPGFPAAAGRFDSPTHHFHEAGSAGAQCVACHMPSRTYMQIQPRPDHSLRVPRPDLSVKIGTPNACNGCHADRSAQWAAERVAAWYGPNRRQEPHYGEVFAAARAGRPGAGEALARLAADPQQPVIVRATALNALRADGSTGIATRMSSRLDPDPEVRAAAADSFESVPPAQRVYALAPLLTDPVRAVRIAAARGLSSLPPARIAAEHRPAFDAALAEYIAVQRVSLDMPGAQLNLAVVYQNTGRTELAEKHYLAALKLDPDFTPARANLAMLYHATARNADAERVLEEGLRRQPGIGELQYSLGLMLAEAQRLPEAAAALAKAAEAMPERARVHYNLGLALQQLGRLESAESALLTAQRLDPLDPAPPYALAIFHAQAGRQARALEWAEKLEALDPASAQARDLVSRLRAQRGRGP